jgi:hypothetical protein
MGQMANAVSVEKLSINPLDKERLEATAEVHRHICDRIHKGLLREEKAMGRKFIERICWIAEHRIFQTGEKLTVSYKDSPDTMPDNPFVRIHVYRPGQNRGIELRYE